jgi:hypothetical protein
MAQFHRSRWLSRASDDVKRRTEISKTRHQERALRPEVRTGETRALRARALRTRGLRGVQPREAGP